MNAHPTDPTSEFFGQLAERGHEPVLEKLTGTLRFDLVDGNRVTRWYVAVQRGDVAVSRKSGPADATIRAEKELFDGVVAGKVNPLAAILRGTIAVQGDSELLALFQRLFPAPPRSSEQ